MKIILLLSVIFSATCLTAGETYPYHVSIENNGKHVCSGAIIAPKLIITTASCTKNLQELNLHVRAGTNILEEGGVLKDVMQVKRHTRYTTNRKDYNIAVIILHKELSFNDKIQPVKLPASLSTPATDTTGTLTSWGLDNAEGFSRELESANVKISIPINCKNTYASHIIYITERMFCAELKDKKACKADSGSPLVSNNVLLGISAWEQSCGGTRYPGIYTNIGNLIKWINTEGLEVVKKDG